MGDEDILDDLENCLAEAENDVIETIEDKEEEIKGESPKLTVICQWKTNDLDYNYNWIDYKKKRIMEKK